MTLSKLTRDVAGAAALLALVAATVHTAAAGEKHVGTYGEERALLRFKVPDATVQKLLPEGWQASPDSAGPSKDANLNVVFVDVFTAQNPDGKPEDPYRVAAVVIPAKKRARTRRCRWLSPVSRQYLATLQDPTASFRSPVLPLTDMSTRIPAGDRTSKRRGNSKPTVAISSS